MLLHCIVSIALLAVTYHHYACHATYLTGNICLILFFFSDHVQDEQARHLECHSGEFG